MDGLSTLSAIDQKMAEMRIKNLELLKRHQVCTWMRILIVCLKRQKRPREYVRREGRERGGKKRTYTYICVCVWREDSPIDIYRLRGPFFLSYVFSNDIAMRTREIFW